MARLGRFAEQADQGGDAAEEGEADRQSANRPGDLGRQRLEPDRDHDRADEREEQDQPGPSSRRHPRSSLRASTSSGSLRRKIATISPSPTTTSQAATTITTI